MQESLVQTNINDKACKEILQNTKTIAILGLSQDSSKPSYKVAKYLQDKGYKIFPIAPKGGEILGNRVYTSLEEAFACNSIDILNVFRKSEALPQIAKEVLELKNPPKCVWVQLGLSSKEAKEILKDFLYFENACIKIEHQRLMYDSNL